jgi:Squalene-hopene cyclase C-terminal domain/Prenyltransferase and squalene oxidase repeat
LAIDVACPKCGFRGKAPDQVEGKLIKCRQCGNGFRATRGQAVADLRPAASRPSQLQPAGTSGKKIAVVLGLAGLLGCLAVGGLLAWRTLKGDSTASKGNTDGGLAAGLTGDTKGSTDGAGQADKKKNEEPVVQEPVRKVDDPSGTEPPVKKPPEAKTDLQPDAPPVPKPPEPKEGPPKPPADGKWPVPDKAKLAAARDRVENLYEVSKAKDKAALANRLLEEGQWPMRDPQIAAQIGAAPGGAERYVMLDLARELYAQAGLRQLAFQAIDSMEVRHRIDKGQLQISTLETLGQSAETWVLQELAGFAANSAEDTIRQDRYESAARLLAIVDAAAKKLKNTTLQDTVATRLKQVANLQKEYDAVKPAKEQLAKNPDDPEANLAWGRFLLFVKKEQWAQAVPYFAKGSDPQLKKLAAQDAGAPGEPKEMLELADGWCALAEAEKGDARKQFLLRARHWFAAAVPRLAGLNQTKAGKQLKELDELLEKEFQVGSFACRTGALKQERLLRGGGNARSEAAVADGLKWLSAHQAPDGSWNAATHGLAGKCNCGNLGHDDPMFGTAMALLALMGAGETPRDGTYAKQVQSGIKWLVSKQKADGTLSANGYIEGMAAIALCEAYGVTRDPELKGPAQKAINALVNWQGPDGGFRYSPKQAGDMSVSSWHIQALKTGELAGLNVPKATWEGVNSFLNRVSDERSGGCGYTGPQATQRMTAAGMLCRQYTGWGPRNPGLNKGVEMIRRVPPSPAVRDMYYFYYATQVMQNVGGESWIQWNAGANGQPGMRDLLVTAQDQGEDKAHPHQKGSWNPSGDAFGAQFGRLGYTCLCVMTLEVYYRHPPLLSKDEK